MAKFKGFNIPCPKCQGKGHIYQNQDHIKWFDCHGCQYSNSWHVVSAEIRLKKLDAIYCPVSHEYMKRSECDPCEMCN